MKKSLLFLLSLFLLIALASCAELNDKLDYVPLDQAQETFYQAVFDDIQTAVRKIRFNKNDTVSSKPWGVKSAQRKYLPLEGTQATVRYTVALASFYGTNSTCELSGMVYFDDVYADSSDRYYSSIKETFKLEVKEEDGTTHTLNATIYATTDKTNGKILSTTVDGTLDGVPFQLQTE